MGTREFSDYIEQHARELVSRPRGRENGFSVVRQLEREIEFTLEHLERIRRLNKSQLNRLLRLECYVDTQLVQANPYTSPHGSYLGNKSSSHPERNVLYQRLFNIEAERGKQAVSFEGQTLELQRRLLVLIQKHEQLSRK